MLLNKLPVLDKGHVAFIDSSLSGKVMKSIEDHHFKGKINKELLESASLTMEIRCPLFFLTFLLQHGVKTVNTIEKEIECYIPDVSEIKTSDIAVNKDIADHMKQTTEALLMTSKAFEQDGLDKSTSYLLTPVSVYNTVVVTGSLTQWIKLISKKRPYAIQAYNDVIKDVMEAEWPKLHTYIKGI